MNPFHYDSDDTRTTIEAGQVTAANVFVSLLVAVFAYCGLAFGGGLEIDPATRPDPNAIASGKNGTPLYLTMRDNGRGMAAPNKDATTKSTFHEPLAALIPGLANASFTYSLSWRVTEGVPSDGTAASGGSYLARAPPAVSA